MAANEWDHTARDEDGFTNAEYSAMGAGERMAPLPDQAKNNLGLVNAYIHGLKSAIADLPVAEHELRNAAEFPADHEGSRNLGEQADGISNYGVPMAKRFMEVAVATRKQLQQFASSARD